MGRRVSSSAFVGRAGQLEALMAALGNADAGEAGAVFIGGESGVGKTRLVAEFERMALVAGARYLVGGCVDVGGSELPYAPLLGALRTLVRDSNPRALEELVGPAGAELGRVLPELQLAGAPSEAVDPLAQSRLFEALLGLLARAGRDLPVVLVIEDLHWADPSTRGFVSFVVRNVRRERLLLVATYRSDELHRTHPLRRFLADVERLPTVDRFELAPFTRRELAEQLAAILEAPPDPALLQELFSRSQGNAFFAEELLAASAGGGARPIPESLRDALTLRVERLSPQARRMVRSAAAAGSVVGHRLLTATAGLTEDELAGAVREAIEHNVLIQDSASESYSFRHTLLRDALYDELLPGERVAMHAALAKALEQDPGLAVGAHGAAAQRATHWSAAHELAAALVASVEAGVEAEQVWAFVEANRHYEHAVELWERVPEDERPAALGLVDLVERAAKAAHFSGQNERAVTLTRGALEAIDAGRDRAAAGLAHERLGRYLLAQGASLDALSEYRAAATLLPSEPSAVRASILAGEGHSLMLQGDLLQARGLCEEAARIAGEIGAADVECDALITLGAVVAMLGAPTEGIALVTRGKRLAEQLGALEELLRSYINLGEALDQAGRLEEAAAIVREGWERLRNPINSVAPFLAAEAGGRLTRLGRWDDALALLADAAETAPPNTYGALVLAVLAELEALLGQLDRAAEHLESAARIPTKGAEMWGLLQRRAEAALALARGRPDELRQIVDPAAPIPPGYTVFVIPMLALALAAEAELAQRAMAAGDNPAELEAVARGDALLTQVRAMLAPGAMPLGPAPAETLLEAELCELESRRVRRDTPVEAWAAHAAQWEELGRPFRGAYARLREAEAARAHGLPRDRIAGPLTSARATAERLGARPLLDEIDRLSRRLRLRGSEDGEELAGGPAGLTDRELEVLYLIAKGRTNPEIGKELYMSPKTASVHVSRILSKLDVRTRTEAIGVAHRLGLLSDRQPTATTSQSSSEG
jgi:DNA-binding CsgD family transcriptional regulator/tetratricopeptide (TPR) repeat protein